jgi:hypothetical protein
MFYLLCIDHKNIGFSQNRAKNKWMSKQVQLKVFDSLYIPWTKNNNASFHKYFKKYLFCSEKLIFCMIHMLIRTLRSFLPNASRVFSKTRNNKPQINTI